MNSVATARTASPIFFDVDTGNYRIRTAVERDVTTDWTRWIEDPYTFRMLNAPRASMTTEEVRGYVAGFNNIDRFIVGFFDQRDGRPVGFGTGDYSDCRRFLRIAFLIGEPAHRNIGAMQEIGNSFLGHVFEILPIESLIGHVLPHNQVIQHLAKAYGWRHVNTLPKAKPKSDGTGFHDILVYALSRDDFKRSYPQQRSAP